MDLAEDALLAVGVLDVQLAPHVLHHGNVVEDLQAVPVHSSVIRPAIVRSKSITVGFSYDSCEFLGQIGVHKDDKV